MASKVLKLDDLELSTEESDARDLIQKIRPEWKPEDVQCEKMKKGRMNTMWRVSNKTLQEEDDDDEIAVKIYGALGTHLFSRSREQKLMEVLNEKRLSLPLYALFKNGFAYKFSKGKNLTAEQLLDINISKLVIEKMHQVHALELPDYKATDASELITKLMEGWNATKDVIIEDEKYKTHFNHDAFSDAIDTLDTVWDELMEEFPPCLCHRDMHMLNLVYREDTHEIAVLDWELSMLAPPVEDIASHLCRDPESILYGSGVLLPEQKEFFQNLLRLYLETHPQYGKQPVSQELVDKWVYGTYKAMAYNLAMTELWALVQWKTNNDGQGYDHFRFAQEMEHLRTITVEMLKTGLK